VHNRKILAASLCLFILLILSTPAPAAAVWTPQAQTTENNTLPPGLSLPDNITASLTYQTTAPTGISDISAQTGDGTETTTQPTGSVVVTARDNTGSETNTKPTDSVTVNALTGDGSEANTKPDGSVAITARIDDGSEVNARPSGANDPNAQAVNANSTITLPDADVTPSEQTVNSTITNTQPTGAPTPNAQSVATTDQDPTDEPASFAEAASAAENNWYLGTCTLAENAALNLAVDDSGTGSFVEVYLDLDGDGVYLEDTDSDNTTGSLTSANEDIYLENIQVSDAFTIDGVYYRASLAAGFTTTDNTAYITSDTWATGYWSVDVDNDGVLDNLYFVTIDNNSDDNFDMIVISFNNTDYGEGNLADGEVQTANDENLWATGGNLDVGAYNYNLTTLATWPETATDDAGITMDTWYYNEPATAENVWVDNEGSGTPVELYYCIWDPDSDGIFENVALSIDDMDYGEGSLQNKILGPDDDESLSITGSTLTAADNIQISVVYDFEVSFTGDPAGDPTDFSIDSTSWYYGHMAVDIDGDGTADDLNFVLSDDNSDGIFDNLEISSDDNTFGEGTSNNSIADTNDDEVLGAADNVRVGDTYDFEVAAPVSDPANDTPDFSITSTSWWTGTLSIDVDGNGATDTVNFCLSDSDSDGIFDTLDISADDATYGETTGAGTLTDDNAFTDNDERLTAADNIRIGTNLSQSYRYEVIAPVGNPADTSPDYSVTSTSWWTGVIAMDVNGDGTLDDVNFALSDNDSNGIFNVLEISSDDTTFGEGAINDDNAYRNNDVAITSTDNVRIGENEVQQYRYEATLVSNPIGTALAYDFRLTSTCWYTGTLSIDVNDDGTADTVYYALSDNNSDGTFDTLDISGENTTYGQGTLNDNKVSTTGGVTEDERVAAAVSLFKFGDNNQFSIIAPVGNPIGTTPDFSVTSKSWYVGTVQVEMTGDNAKDDLHICLLDENSDGVFDKYELSAFDDNFGQGTAAQLTDHLIAENLAENNDERLTATTDNLHLAPQRIRYEVFAPVANPQAQTVDFKMRAKSWYTGTITLHAGNTFNFVILDENSDGEFDNLVFDADGDGSYDAENHYNSYPVSPIWLPSSPYAYKVIWFNRNPPYADATYGAYDLVMQPLDTASPTFSSPSPAEGTTTSDASPTISVNLSDVGTGGYTFGIESIVMKVRGEAVSHTYSGGVVSYAPAVAISPGEVSVSVTASDYAKNSASTSWSFTIEGTPGSSVPANAPPNADADGPYYVLEGRTVELDGTGSSDPEGDTLTYSWAITNDPTGAASLTDTNAATPSFHAPEDVEGSVSVAVELTVDDGHGHSDSSIATVAVLEEFEIESEAVVDNIEAGESTDVDVENTWLTGLKITARNSIQNARVNVGQFAEAPSGVPPASGTLYGYIYVATENLAKGDVENVVISFKVEKSWIAGENIDVGTIVLQRYNPATGSWENLTTEKVDESAEFAYFEAASTSLSVFAITGSPAQLPTAPSAPMPSFWVMAVVAIALVAVLTAVIWRYLSKP